MLDMARVAQALTARRDDLASYQSLSGLTMETLRGEFARVAAMPRRELEALLAGCPSPGARPGPEHDTASAPTIPFPQRWRNHQEARAWALQVLSGVTVIAVDGSQIAPSREYSLPVGAVQIGWFENPHHHAGRYVKDISFEILAPGDLAGSDGEGAFPDSEVNLRRFEGECERLRALMAAHSGEQHPPVCLFDGSLIVSFAQHLGPAQQTRYVRAVTEMLSTSERLRIPLFGYVDTSYAADLVAMLDHLAGRQVASRASDAALLQPLMQWGDRTPGWICARNDRVAPVDGASYYEQVAFVYLKTTGTNPPARLDLPRWLLEDATALARTLDVIRAECIVGNGYPYAAETADAVAVITSEDRERFYAALQRFAEREGLPFHHSRKAGSKRQRR